YDAVAAQEAETRRAYQAADALTKSERARADEAERRFRQSKELTDLVLKISEEEIGSDSPFQGPRRRLLRAALDNYRNLMADRRGPALDPAVRAELIRVLTVAQRQRLRQIFLQFLGPMAFNDPDVVERLALTPAQRQQIRVIQAEEFGPPFVRLGGPPNRPGGPPGGPPKGPGGPPGGPKDNPDARAKGVDRILDS